MIKLLLIEDNQQTISDIQFSFQLRYPDVFTLPATSRQSALDTLKVTVPTIIILDSSLSGIGTIKLIGDIRQWSDAPLLILGQSETDIDRSRELESGADMYIAKPYNPIELLAMCHTLLRRAKNTFSSNSLSFNNLTIDFNTREVFLSGEPIELTPVEYRLLSELAKNVGHVVSMEELLTRVWGSEYVKDLDLVKAYIYRLRRKLESGFASEQLILNERGFGYRLGKERRINRVPSLVSDAIGSVPSFSQVTSAAASPVAICHKN